jgi:hypothetical protein
MRTHRAMPTEALLPHICLAVRTRDRGGKSAGACERGRGRARTRALVRARARPRVHARPRACPRA